MAVAASGGRVCEALSDTTRMAANGSPCPSAHSAATCDSMSTTEAPLFERERSLVGCGHHRLVHPDQHAFAPRAALLTLSAPRKAASSAGVGATGRGPPRTTVASTTAPTGRSAASAPATPKLTTADSVSGSTFLQSFAQQRDPPAARHRDDPGTARDRGLLCESAHREDAPRGSGAGGSTIGRVWFGRHPPTIRRRLRARQCEASSVCAAAPN